MRTAPAVVLQRAGEGSVYFNEDWSVAALREFVEQNRHQRTVRGPGKYIHTHTQALTEETQRDQTYALSAWSSIPVDAHVVCAGCGVIVGAHSHGQHVWYGRPHLSFVLVGKTLTCKRYGGRCDDLEEAQGHRHAVHDEGLGESGT